MKILRTLASSLFFLVIVFLASGFELSGTEELRQFDQLAIARYKADPTFDYSTEYAKSDSVLGLLILYFVEKLGALFQSSGMGDWLPFILRLLVVLVVLAVVYYILKYRYGSVIEPNSKNFVPVGVAISGDEQVDYDQLIQESKAAGDYQLAIRYLFLKCLHDLHQSEIIKISTWKAPLDYVRELPGDKRQPFTDLVNLFEMTWYGEYVAKERELNKSVKLVELVKA